VKLGDQAPQAIDQGERGGARIVGSRELEQAHGWLFFYCFKQAA
jgi:hypothetical protein